MKVLTGSITDDKAVLQALRGVNIVIHIASIIDPSQFPNTKLLHEVNCKGKHFISYLFQMSDL